MKEGIYLNERSSINIGGLEFGWDIEKGQFIFEGEESVLFWISSAMKEFFDTIEEISGEEASNLVFETTGFRQGLVVGKYFETIKEVGIEEAVELITNTYATAGWGRMTIKDLDLEKKTLVAELKDSWEYKINIAQGKATGGHFLPAHYAGIFTGLFSQNMWYKVVHHQIEGHETTVVEYFPSEISITRNIHELSRKKESTQIAQLNVLVDEKTKELQKLVDTLSSPIIPVLDGIVVVPLIGQFDEMRTEKLIVKTLSSLPSHKAEYLLLDLTGLDRDITPFTTNLIDKMVSAASLIGTKTILVGISSELAISISNAVEDFSKFNCFQTLQHGIYYALGQSGRQII